MGGDLVTFCLMEEAPLQPGCNGKPCLPKIFKANHIAWFFCNGLHQNQHHDWNLLNKFWLLTTFGVLFKVSFKVKLLSIFKIQNIILPSICRHEWSKCQSQSHICKLYIFLIDFLLLLILYILFKLPIPDKKNLQSGFCLFLHILKCNYWQA